MLEAPGVCCSGARMVLMRLNLSLAHLALSADASETGGSWEKRELVDKGKPRQACGIQPCVIKSAERQGLLKNGVSLVWLNNLHGK